MQTISFLLFRLLAFVVKNHLKREKNSKKIIIFSLYHHPLPRIRPHFCPDPDPPKKIADPKP